MIKKLRKFFLLPKAERFLLARAFFLLVIVRLGLRLFRFSTLLRILERIAVQSISLSQKSSLSTDKIASAITTTSLYVCGATCLARALAANVLLQQHGHPSLLRIGVAKDELERLEAHAWVESQGKILLGGTSEYVSYYRPFPALNITQLGL